MGFVRSLVMRFSLCKLVCPVEATNFLNPMVEQQYRRSGYLQSAVKLDRIFVCYTSMCLAPTPSGTTCI